VVHRYSKVSEIIGSHILFVNSTDKDLLKNVFNTAKDGSILTVGDGLNFARHGGMVRFYTDNAKIRIRINTDATKDADFTISSKLLRLADIIGTENN
jgi:hypothetical protein